MNEPNGNGNETYEQPVLATDASVEDEWDTAKLAKLVNFDDSPEIPSPIVLDEEVEEANSSPNGNAVPLSELFDDPIEGQTQPGFHKRGINKAAATGGVLLIGFAVVGVFLNSVFNSSPRRVPSVASSPTPVATPSITPTPGTETGNLKTEVAIGKQADQIKALEGSKSPKTQVAKKTQRTARKPVSSPSPVPRIAPSYSSPPRTYSQPYRQYSPPPSLPRTAFSGTTVASPQPQLVSAAPAPLSVSNSVTPKLQEQAKQAREVDPMQQWMAANRIGSYGTSNVGDKEPIVMAALSGAPVVGRAEGTQTASVKSANDEVVALRFAIPRAIPVVSATDGVVVAPQESATPEVGSTASLDVPPKEATKSQAQQDLARSSTEPTSQSEQAQLASSQVNPAEEASILNSTPVRQLTVGGMAPGQLVTPVIWAGAAKSATQAETPEKFIVQLAQPLTDKDGSVTLPQGTQIVATVVGINESGLAQLEATQAIVDGQEYVLPPRAIDIRGTDGQPLIASKWRDKGKAIAQGDATAFLFGSLSRVGQVLTQPDSESSTSVGGYGYSSTTASRSGGRNVLGAVLDGGFTPLAQQILKRNEQRVQEITSRPDVWYVRAGENVQVFVNRSFEF